MKQWPDALQFLLFSEHEFKLLQIWNVLLVIFHQNSFITTWKVLQEERFALVVKHLLVSASYIWTTLLLTLWFNDTSKNTGPTRQTRQKQFIQKSQTPSYFRLFCPLSFEDIFLCRIQNGHLFVSCIISLGLYTFCIISVEM